MANNNLAGVIVMVTLEIAFIYSLIWLRHKHFPLQKNREGLSYFEMVGTHLRSSTSKNGSSWNVLLCVTRVLSFLYFLIVGWALNWDMGGADNDYPYFTHWNLVLLTIYFFLVSVCSIAYVVGLPVSWRDYNHPLATAAPNIFGPASAVERFAQNAARVHDVAGSCAFFITVVNFGVLDPSPATWNVINHLTNSIFMVWELANNNIEGSMESYKWNVSWLYFYVIFTWGLVGTGVKGWPYFFLDTTSSACYAWYEGLIILHFIFFLIWVYIAQFKFYVATYFGASDFSWGSSTVTVSPTVPVDSKTVIVYQAPSAEVESADL